MDSTSPAPSQGPPSSPPTKASFNIENVSRLSDSMWSTKPPKNIAVKPKQPSLPTTHSNGPFSSDPITSQDLEPTTTATKLLPLKHRKRKCQESSQPVIHHTKVMRIAEPKITQQDTYSSAIQKARDILINAYNLTNCKEKQDSLLDLVEVFRNFTENGRISIKQNINTIDTPMEPSTPITQTTRITPAAPAVQSYAEIVKNKAAVAPTTILAKLSSGMKVLGNNIQQTKLDSEIIQTKTNTVAPSITTKAAAIKTGTETLATAQFASHNVITLVTKPGGNLPTYQPYSIRENINKILGKRAISRVHTSIKGNIVLTCMDSTPSELLLDQDKWETVFAGWPIQKIQKITHWPKVVVHGVPTCIPLQALNEEIEIYNKGIKTQGEPRWLTRTHKQSSKASVTFSVTTEEEKEQLLESGVMIGGLYLKAVNYQQATHTTQCRNCLAYGHHQTLCNKPPVCVFCSGKHLTSAHCCITCKSTESCIHHAVQCTNCKSNTHLAFQKQDCDYFKALSC